MGRIDNRIAELGITLPEASSPIANYATSQRSGNLVFFSGAGAFDAGGSPLYQGKLGAEVSKSEGYQAARSAAVTLIANMKKEIGDLDKVTRIVKLLGFVASSDGFYEQPYVINGASDLFVEVFGEAGKHSRSAVGVSSLPLNLPVEIEIIVEASV